MAQQQHESIPSQLGRQHSKVESDWSPTDGSTLNEHQVSTVAGTKEKQNDADVVVVEPTECDSPSTVDAQTAPATSLWLLKFLRSTPMGRYLSGRAGNAQHNIPDHNIRRAPPWATTLLRIGPLSGILATFLALASLIASLGILGRWRREQFSLCLEPRAQ